MIMVIVFLNLKIWSSCCLVSGHGRCNVSGSWCGVSGSWCGVNGSGSGVSGSGSVISGSGSGMSLLASLLASFHLLHFHHGSRVVHGSWCAVDGCGSVISGSGSVVGRCGSVVGRGRSGVSLVLALLGGRRSGDADDGNDQHNFEVHDEFTSIFSGCFNG